MFSKTDNMRSAVFLQARLGSSRLPHKVLLDLQGRSVLEHGMRRLSLVNTDVHAVLTDSNSFPVISEICAEVPGWECFEGPAEDVLARYVFAVRHFSVDSVIRATADNPLVSFRLANKLLDISSQQHTESEYGHDYLAHSGIPYGAGVECVAAEALETAFIESIDPYDHEHVCPYIYHNPHKFNIGTMSAPMEFQGSDIRLTLDTKEDYQYLSRLFLNQNMDALPDLPAILRGIYSLAV